jgi:hypothetical protein
MCSMMGRLHTGSMGLGWLAVSGRRRVPSPPAMITAFTGDLRWSLPAAPGDQAAPSNLDP